MGPATVPPGACGIVCRVDPLTERDPARVGPYTLLARCGDGRLGPAYLGRSPAGDLVAVQVVPPRLAADAAAMAGLAGHLTRARAIRTAAVAAIVDADLDAQQPWLASEFVTGPALSDVVPLGDAAAALLGLRLAEALVDLHARGWVHGALEPAGVRLAADGPRLADPGLAHAVGSLSTTQVGMALDDPHWLSPEQALGDAPCARSDVFSLVSVVVHAARGSAPFEAPGGSPLDVVRRILAGPPDLSGIAPDLADHLVPAFAGRPEHRCDAADLAHRLAEYVESVDATWPAGHHDAWMRAFAAHGSNP